MRIFIMSEDKTKNTQEVSASKSSNNMIFLVLGVLIVAGIAALAFVSNTVIAENGDEQATSQQMAEAADEKAQTETTAGTENNTENTAAAESEPESFDPNEGPSKEITVGDTVIKPGNPVVAKIGPAEIRRGDVLNFISQLPPQMRQQPIQDLFPLALEQTINARILEQKAAGTDIDEQDSIQQQIENARANIIRTAFVQQIVEEGVTEEAIRAQYEEYVANLPETQEVKARHILLESEEEAQEMVKQLEQGAEFEELAQEHSIGPSASEGGDLGYFAEGQMVPEFGDAAFALEPGNYTQEPVQTQFGWHVIKVEDKRERPTPSLEEVRTLLENEIKRDVLDNRLADWKKDLEIQTYDINGETPEEEGTQTEG
jgi:peptidyl-prolyl cis-trans isomerase C